MFSSSAYHFPISSSSVRRRYTIQHTVNHASLVFLTFTFCFTVYHIIFTILSNHLDVTITFSPSSNWRTSPSYCVCCGSPLGQQQHHWFLSIYSTFLFLAHRFRRLKQKGHCFNPFASHGVTLDNHPHLHLRKAYFNLSFVAAASSLCMLFLLLLFPIYLFDLLE